MNINIEETILCLFAAVVSGGIIGYEREIKSKPAGLKTHMLVCIGATLVALIQREMIYEIAKIAQTNSMIEELAQIRTSDMIANVITGVGFLGAGTIIVTKGRIEGLTTAASIWSVAMVGLAIGLGFWKLAILSLIIIYVVLEFIEKAVNSYYDATLEIEYTRPDCLKDDIEDYLISKNAKNITIISLDYNHVDNTHVILYSMQLPQNINKKKMITEIANLNSIHHIVLI